MISKNKISFTLIFEYLFILLIVLNGNSVYHAEVDASYHFDILCGIFSFIAGIKVIQRKGLQISFILLILYLLFYFIIQKEYIKDSTYLSLYILGLPFMVQVFKDYRAQGRPYHLLYILANIITAITCLSLIVWFIGPVMGWIHENCSIKIDWGGIRLAKGYYYLVYNIQNDTTYDILFSRNSSIFTEAPMFNLWLMITLSIELFLRPKINYIRLSVVILGILSTISTTGFICILICIILKYYKFVSKMPTGKKIIIGSILLAIISITTYYLLSQMLILKMQTASYEMRMDDYDIGMKVWKKHPLFGCGYGNINPISSGSELGYANSIMALLSTGGIWISIIVLVPITIILFRSLKHNQLELPFLIIFIYEIISTYFIARFIFIFLLAFAYSIKAEKYRNLTTRKIL